MNNAILDVRNLKMQYNTRHGAVRAVDGVSFALEKGKSLGIVGESGSGKSSLAMTLLKLLPDNGRLTGGHAYLDGVDLAQLDEGQMRQYRWKKMSIVFQSAMNSLNPVYKVGDQIMEAIQTHLDLSATKAKTKVAQLFDMVGLDAGLVNRYPHEFSGGMKQRAVIAMALVCDPDVVIADEPTTALDVIVQDRIIRQLRQIQEGLGNSMIYISHDMAVIAEVCDSMGVMYAGKLVEVGQTSDLFQRPRHPYTAALMSAFPSVTGEKRELDVLEGEPPNLIDPPQGCRFHPRCPYVAEICRQEEPPMAQTGNQQFACWNPLVY